MEEQIDKLLTELKKVKKLNNNYHRPNVSGLRVKKQHGLDYKYGTYHTYGFGCESLNFGIQEVKYLKKEDGRYQESKWNSKYPEIYQAILDLALYVIPEDFEMNGLCNICLNKNLKCLPHNDSNKGDSIIIGLGDYQGGRLILHHNSHDEYIDIRNRPFKFNGKKIKHSTEDFVGDRWSVIYYT
jgi:hypothetical protein